MIDKIILYSLVFISLFIVGSIIGNLIFMEQIVSQIKILQGICDKYEEMQENFNDEMLILAETLKIYHELLDGYQIPMIINPYSREKESDSEW